MNQLCDYNRKLHQRRIDCGLRTCSTPVQTTRPPFESHTDTAFRNVLPLKKDGGGQLTDLLNSAAIAILRPFRPLLTTPTGAVVALSSDASLIARFTSSAYHGTVVWVGNLLLLQRGLNRSHQHIVRP